MIWERVRVGLVSGVVSFAPLLLVFILTNLQLITGDGAVSLALMAFPLSILVGGALAGYLVGQGRRKRSESKVMLGGLAGGVAGLLFGVVLEVLFLVRSASSSAATQDDPLAVHPVRVTFAIVLMVALMVAVAMVSTMVTAKPLPPPRRVRRMTGQMPALPPTPQHDPNVPAR